MIWKAARFGVSAGLVWGSDFLLFLALYPHIGIAAALFLARVTGGVVGFAAHKWLSFSSKSRPSRAEVLKFSALWVVNYAIALAGIGALVGSVSASPEMAKILLDVVIFASNYFIMSRIFRA